jgi:hypothetical protein
MYIRPKVVGSFSGPCASGSYVHQAAILKTFKWFYVSILSFIDIIDHLYILWKGSI